MLRTFERHVVRKQKELSGRFWDFSPLEGENKGMHYSMMVPGCWETYPGFENYRGSALYETFFEGEGNIRLEFKGVSHGAKVLVNGVEVVTHYNAYTPFDTVIKGMEKGSNRLTVYVENSFKPEYSLNRPNDYMSYGGISRGVLMEEVPDVYISNIHVTPIEENGMWQARIEVYCHNLLEQQQDIQIELSLHTGKFCDGAIQVMPGNHKVVDTIIDFESVETWSPESPALYEVKTLLKQNDVVIDDLIDRVGFRTVRIVGNRILLNDKPIRIKGFCRHEDHPQYGNALPVQAMAHDLNLIKDMGGNSVRTAHYPNDELFLDLCDEMGILVWEENHMRGGGEDRMANPYFQPQAEQVIEEMITLHYNHPSIYIWGILNECASDTELGRSCYKKQYELIRKLDQSRPCSSATCKFEADICLDLPDVVSWNIYPYWYEERTAAKMLDDVYLWSQDHGGADKPFMVTEIGAGAFYGFRSPEHDKWTEEYQATTLGKQLTEVMAYENCMGLYIWQFCDIRVSKEWFAERPRCRNNKGIVDEFRRRKLSYDVVKKIFSESPNYWDE